MGRIEWEIMREIDAEEANYEVRQMYQDYDDEEDA